MAEPSDYLEHLYRCVAAELRVGAQNLDLAAECAIQTTDDEYLDRLFVAEVEGSITGPAIAAWTDLALRFYPAVVAGNTLGDGLLRAALA